MTSPFEESCSRKGDRGNEGSRDELPSSSARNGATGDDEGPNDEIEGIRFVDYVNESQLDHVMSLVGRDLSEPYSST
jgi:hypothetical protein